MTDDSDTTPIEASRPKEKKVTAHITKEVTESQIVDHCGRTVDIPESLREKMAANPHPNNMNPGACDCDPCREAYGLSVSAPSAEVTIVKVPMSPVRIIGPRAKMFDVMLDDQRVGIIRGHSSSGYVLEDINTGVDAHKKRRVQSFHYPNYMSAWWGARRRWNYLRQYAHDHEDEQICRTVWAWTVANLDNAPW